MVTNKDSVPKNELNVPDIDTGVYRHYKGNLYDVIGVALHSESIEPLVVYRPLYETRVSYWVRPYKMFTDVMKVDNKMIQRFEKCKITPKGDR